MVAVAQLVESRIVIPVVVGSSPISHPKDSKGLQVILQAFFFVSTLTDTKHVSSNPLCNSAFEI